MTIRFCSRKVKYGFLSNFYPSPFIIDKVDYRTVEHFFQAFKTDNDKQRKAIISAASPSEAKRLGRVCTLREDWEDVKEKVMLLGLKEKFAQNFLLYKKLLATGEEQLIEDTKDVYWGGTAPLSKNRLGELLMHLRSYFMVSNINQNYLWQEGLL